MAAPKDRLPEEEKRLEIEKLSHDSMRLRMAAESPFLTDEEAAEIQRKQDRINEQLDVLQDQE